MRKIMSDLDVEILSADEAGITEDIIEDGLTFEENALIKAKYVMEKVRQSSAAQTSEETWAFADDSGVCIKALGCAPGIFSARWARKRGEDSHNGEVTSTHTLEVMKHIPKVHRGAWMESACALVSPAGRYWVFTGKVYGSFTEKPRGVLNPRMPYDVIFEPEGYNITFAEMTADQKNSLSHRGKAFEELKKFLREEVMKEI